MKPVAVGIDSLYLGHFCDGLSIEWEVLRYEKEKLRATSSAIHAEIGFGGERFALHRSGLWRAEVQIRSARLKQAGIGTTDQLKAYLPSLTKSLARHHTSLRAPSGDSNRSRWPLHPLWRGVIASTDQLTKPPDRPPPPLRTGSEYALQRQLRSVLGHMKGIAATLSIDRPANPVTLKELLTRFPHLVGLLHSPALAERCRGESPQAGAGPVSAPRRRGVLPANDNGDGKRPLRALLDMPEGLPIQFVEVEAFAELLDSYPIATNDNAEGGS